MPSPLRQSDKMIDLIARRFRLLGEPFRLRLLQALEPGERTVGDLALELDGNQPNVSRHLQLLHDAGVVSRRRDGNSIYYGIADPMVMKLCDLVCQSAVERVREDYQDFGRSGRTRREAVFFAGSFQIALLASQLPLTSCRARRRFRSHAPGACSRSPSSRAAPAPSGPNRPPKSRQ